MKQNVPFSDMEMLSALYLVEAQGLSRARAVMELNRMFGAGRTRNSVIGVVARVNADADRHPCHCQRAENRDGGMPGLWWQRRRKAAGGGNGGGGGNAAI